MDFLVGIVLTVVAAVINGNFALPLKYARKWKWENSWAVYSLVALWIVPWMLAGLSIPKLSETFSSLSLSQLATPLLFGTGWGISQVLLGISVARVGMALTFAIVIGFSATLGTLIPLLRLNPGFLFSGKGTPVVAGIAIMLGGIYLCAKAGRERDRVRAAAAPPAAASPAGGSGYGAALAITITAGILTPMLNYALAFGEPVLKKAVELGASPANATYAVWLIALMGGLAVNLPYCLYQLTQNKTWPLFSVESYDWVGAVLMGVMWMGSIALYGVGTTHLGPSGAAIGWGLFSIFIILAANLSGVITGEWWGAGIRTGRTLALGLGMLTIASILIAWGNRQQL